MQKVEILEAKLHRDLKYKVNEFLESLGNRRADNIQYQDSDTGCSCMIVYTPARER